MLLTETLPHRGHVFLTSCFTAIGVVFAACRSRIGRRVLADQYSELRQRYLNHTGQREGMIGFIVSKCDPREHGERAFQIAAELCKAKYGDAPKLVITGPSAPKFNYLPRHIDYMLLELFKNAARAVMER